MADNVQASDRAKRDDTTDSIANFNLLDIARPQMRDAQRAKVQGPSDAPAIQSISVNSVPSQDAQADLNLTRAPRINTLLNADAWQTKPLADIYDGGVFKLMTDASGKKQFGLRVTQEQEDANRMQNLKGLKLHERMSLSFEYQLKF